MRERRRLAICHPEFLEDLRYWEEHDRRAAKRLLELVEATLRDPFTTIGKPEPLRHLGADVWSRRLTQEHPAMPQAGIWYRFSYTSGSRTRKPAHSPGRRGAADGP
jgi:toxin YoeB